MLINNQDLKADQIILQLDISNSQVLNIIWLDLGKASYNYQDKTGALISKKDSEKTTASFETGMTRVFKSANIGNKLLYNLIDLFFSFQKLYWFC